jgi:hypothetical protein
MSITGYYGMADGKVFTDPVLGEIASAHGRSNRPDRLRWLVQQDGVVAFSKTVSEARAAENLAIFDFDLSSGEMTAIHKLARSRWPHRQPRWPGTGMGCRRLTCASAGWSEPAGRHSPGQNICDMQCRDCDGFATLDGQPCPKRYCSAI